MHILLTLTCVCISQQYRLIQALSAPQPIELKCLNNGHLLNNVCVLMLQVKGLTSPLMSVHPIRVTTALHAWIMLMTSHAFVNLGGQAKHVMWT